MSASQVREKTAPHERVKRLVAWLDGQVGRLFPGYFALVMATGIISNTLYLEGHRGVSNLMFGANLVTFPWLVLLTSLRAARASKALWADLTNPRLVFSFFTIVAASDVLGLGMNLRGQTVNRRGKLTPISGRSASKNDPPVPEVLMARSAACSAADRDGDV
ncbi:MAG: hypothetical protein KAX36_00860, partial [Thermoflexales bacterium]|nr:hypothetical protein [Thermoflexales bacterium]